MSDFDEFPDTPNCDVPSVEEQARSNRAEARPGPRVDPPHAYGLPALEPEAAELLAALDGLRRISGASRYRSDPLFRARLPQLKRIAAFLSARLRDEPDNDEVAVSLAWARGHLGYRT